MAIADKELTAEEFFALSPAAGFTELIRGKVVELNPPGFLHGYVCTRLGYVLVAEAGAAGFTIGNDSGVITERNPDTVRGPDVAFYSHARMPADAVPEGYPPVSPDVVFEVLSPSDRWAGVLIKAGEYLAADVRAVLVIDPQQRLATLFRPEAPPSLCDDKAPIPLPEITPEFQLHLRDVLPRG